MTTGQRTNFTPHLIVGFGFIFLGTILALDRLGIVEAARSLQFWPIGLIALGGAMVVQAFRGGGGAQQAPGNPSPFPVGPAIVLLVFVLAFARPFRSHHDREEANERPELIAVLSGDHRTIVATPFLGAKMMSVMGGAELDLRRATIPPGGEAIIEVFTLMGGSVVRVPSDWIVDLRVTAVMGGVSDERRPAPSAEAPSEPVATPPRVVLKGLAMMGGVVVKR